MADLETLLPQMRAAWMAGGSALACAPADWRLLAGEGPGADAVLAALAGQAMHALFRANAPAGLSPRPLLPDLEAPATPAAVRSRLRRLLAAKGEETQTRALVRLVAARGYAIHPADWMPGPRDDWAPAMYAPWLAWAASEQPAADTGALSLETYDDWSWAERRAGLVRLRDQDPAAARDIIAAKAAAEPAERRLRLAEILERRLGPDDISLLETLEADRTERIQALARRLMARLGRRSGDPALAAELAGMIALGKTGLIRRRTRLELAPLKTSAQENRRRELLGLVAFADLLAALGSDEASVLEQVPSGEPMAVARFVDMVAETGSDAGRKALLDRILEDDDAPISLVVPLGLRADAAERKAALERVMARDASPGLAISLAFAGDTLGCASPPALQRSPAFAALPDLLRAAGSDDTPARTKATPLARTLLSNLGLLLAPSAAGAVIEACAACGLSAADPRLDLLHLNAALEPERPT
jgi:hypothetical protein